MPDIIRLRVAESTTSAKARRATGAVKQVLLRLARYPRFHMLGNSFHDWDNYCIAELFVSLSVRNWNLEGTTILVKPHEP
jgi:hypothetical protein